MALGSWTAAARVMGEIETTLQQHTNAPPEKAEHEH